MAEARIIRAYHTLGQWIDGIYAVDLDHPSGKDRMLRQALGEQKAAPEECVMIGDRASDIESGRAAGMRTIAVLYGFGAEEELRQAKADFYVASPAELEERLLSLITEK